MASSYYLVLGVGEDANLPQIKRAFSRLAHQLHPDQNAAGEREFIHLKCAYDTITKPIERAKHDWDLGHHRPIPRPRRLVADGPIDLFGDFERHAPSIEEMMDLIARNFTRRREPKARHWRDLNLDILLTPAEAMCGGVVHLTLPVAKPCAACQGSGRTGDGECEICDGRGSDRLNAPVAVMVPPHVADGALIPVSLRPLGILNLYLNVHIRLAGVACA